MSIFKKLFPARHPEKTQLEHAAEARAKAEARRTTDPAAQRRINLDDQARLRRAQREDLTNSMVYNDPSLPLLQAEILAGVFDSPSQPDYVQPDTSQQQPQTDWGWGGGGGGDFGSPSPDPTPTFDSGPSFDSSPSIDSSNGGGFDFGGGGSF